MLSFLLFAFLDAEGMSVFVGLCVGFVVFLAVLYAVSYWFLQDKGECTDRPDMTGKVCVVTGTTRGLGRVAARRLASCGATVVMLNRNEQAGKDTAAAITSETGNKEVFNVPCDLADLAAVKTASEAVLARWPEIDVLLCNAGILTTELTPTAQGFEPHYGVNFLSHFVLVNNLLPALQKRPEARLVMLSSCGQWFTFGMDFSRLTVEDYTSHNWRYDHFFSYCRSKLAMLLFAKECQRRYGNANLVSVAAAPGVIMTDLWRKISPAVDFFLRYIAFVPLCAFCCDPFHVCVCFFLSCRYPVLKTVEQGAQSEILCCLAPFQSIVPGAYYDHRRPSFAHPQAGNQHVADELWRTAFAQSRDYLLNPQLADPTQQ